MKKMFYFIAAAAAFLFISCYNPDSSQVSRILGSSYYPAANYPVAIQSELVLANSLKNDSMWREMKRMDSLTDVVMRSRYERRRFNDTLSVVDYRALLQARIEKYRQRRDTTELILDENETGSFDDLESLDTLQEPFAVPFVETSNESSDTSAYSN